MRTTDLKSSFYHLFGKIFPVSKFLSFDPIAIDISPLNVRVLKLKRTKIGWIPSIYKTYKLANLCDVLTDEINIDQCKDVINTLEQIKKEFKVKYAVFSLPEVKTYTFETIVPEEAASDIESAIKFQIEENVPLAPDQVVFDSTVAYQDEYSKELKVAVTALSKKSVESFTKFVKSSGITPISFETESSALAKAVIPASTVKPTLLVEIGETYTTAAVVENGAVKYSTTLSVSGSAICKDLKGAEANSLKEELNRLLMYWFTGRGDGAASQKIANAFLVGSAASCPGMIEFLEKHLKIKVEIGNVWQNCFSEGDHIPKISKEESLDFGVVVGLALSSIK